MGSEREDRGSAPNPGLRRPAEGLLKPHPRAFYVNVAVCGTQAKAHRDLVKLARYPQPTRKPEAPRVLGHAVKVGQAVRGVAPEALDAVDVRPAGGELVIAMMDPQVLGVAHVDQAVVAGPAVAVDDRVQANPATNRFLQRLFLHIRHDLRINPIASFEHLEHDRLAPAPRPRLPRTRRGPK